MRLRYVVLSLVAATFSLSVSADPIRVRLFEAQNPARVELKAAGGAVALYAERGGSPLLTLPAGQAVRLSRKQGRLYVEHGGGALYATRLHLDDATFELKVLGGTAQAEPRRYAGRLEATAQGDDLLLVHTIDLETYVAAVVTREYGLEDDEGTRAMAVLARTYALRSKGRFGPAYDVVDHTGSQVFDGLGRVSERAEAAARATAGLVLTYEGSLAETVYYASSGGYTASNETVWNGSPIPYLRARPDPYDTQVSPHNRWSVRLARNEVLAALSSGFGGRVTGFTLEGRHEDGRVDEVALRRDGRPDQRVRASEFRRVLSGRFGAMSLRSTRFDARRDGNAYVFEGSGFGHGVGMSQWGAHGQAREGRSFDEILAYYYPGTELGHLDGAPTAPVLAARTSGRTATETRTSRPSASTASDATPTRRPASPEPPAVRTPEPRRTPREEPTAPPVTFTTLSAETTETRATGRRGGW